MHSGKRNVISKDQLAELLMGLLKTHPGAKGASLKRIDTYADQPGSTNWHAVVDWGMTDNESHSKIVSVISNYHKDYDVLPT
jgi:hypothetical protein